MTEKSTSHVACGIFLGESGLSSVCYNFRNYSLILLTHKKLYVMEFKY